MQLLNTIVRYKSSLSSMSSLVVLCGPSGAGKTTLIKKLMSDYPNRFGFSISHTTRSIRCNEKDGVDYHFTTLSDMQNRIQKGEFLEYATVHGNYYGTSFQSVNDVIEQNKICILDIDIQGVQRVMKRIPNATTILIKPPSINELSKRLRQRHTDSEESIQLRLKNSTTELEIAYTLPFTHTIVNDTIERAYAELTTLLASFL